VTLGFRSLQDLDGTPHATMAGWTSDPTSTALLHRVLEAVTVAGSEHRRLLAAAKCAKAPMVQCPCGRVDFHGACLGAQPVAIRGRVASARELIKLLTSAAFKHQLEVHLGGGGTGRAPSEPLK
jgi:hypothetical protein